MLFNWQIFYVISLLLIDFKKFQYYSRVPGIETFNLSPPPTILRLAKHSQSLGKNFAYLVSSLLLGPVEAGILAWLTEKFWFLNPIRLLPGYSRGNSFGTNKDIGGSVTYGTNNMLNNVGNNGNQIFSGTVIRGSFGSLGNIPPFPTGIDIKGPLVYTNGQIESGSFDTTIYSSEYKVRIRQYRGNGGECEEEIMVVWSDKSTGKTIYAKCDYGVSRRTIVRDNLILIGSPNEKFCAFTTNKNEIYYLDNGKWKKGDFSGDNKNDKELTSSEVSRIKERIKKWEEFFVKYNKEIERIKNLKNVKNETRNISKEQIKALRNKERENHRGIIDNIRQLRNEERNKYRNEKQNIKNIRRKEGWSERVDKLEAEEDRRHNIEDARLDQMISDEDVRQDNEDNRYDALLNEEDRKYDEEIRKLDDLRDNEDLRVSREIKQMISQGL